MRIDSLAAGPREPGATAADTPPARVRIDGPNDFDSFVKMPTRSDVDRTAKPAKKKKSGLRA
ncbi:MULTISPECIES: hypothetical protein [Burkholderia]|uniref:hypothetical protein n=1 Tax=Burkholderia TaxID=32008 RepID=UPI001269DFFD|nr:MULTISPECIES: hypothetical protein [Burkholderia]